MPMYIKPVDQAQTQHPFFETLFNMITGANE